MVLLRTRRTSSCSKAFRSCSSLEAVRTLSTALGRIAPEAGEAGEAGEACEAGEAGVRGLPSASACPAGVETCRQIEVLGRRLWLGAAATLDRNSQNPEEAAVSIIWVRGRGPHLRRACGHADRRRRQARHLLRGLPTRLLAGGGDHWLLGPARLVVYDRVL